MRRGRRIRMCRADSSRSFRPFRSFSILGQARRALVLLGRIDFLARFTHGVRVSNGPHESMHIKHLILLTLLASCARKDNTADTTTIVDSAAGVDTARTPAKRDSASQSQRDMFVDRGACPFECCTYGQWHADSAVALRASPDSSAPIVGTVASGTTVAASTGEVHVRPGVFVMSRGERAYSLDRSGPPTPGDSFRVGDTLLVYTSRGEGAYKVRLVGSTGPMFELMLASPGTGCERSNACNGRLLAAPVSTWWANVRAPNGTTGWTTDTRHFSGRDRCGGPVPASPKRG